MVHTIYKPWNQTTITLCINTNRQRNDSSPEQQSSNPSDYGILQRFIHRVLVLIGPVCVIPESGGSSQATIRSRSSPWQPLRPPPCSPDWPVATALWPCRCPCAPSRSCPMCTARRTARSTGRTSRSSVAKATSASATAKRPPTCCTLPCLLYLSMLRVLTLVTLLQQWRSRTS